MQNCTIGKLHRDAGAGFFDIENGRSDSEIMVSAASVEDSRRVCTTRDGVRRMARGKGEGVRS